MRTIEKVTENMTLHTLKIFALKTINRFCYDTRNGENPHEYRLFCPSILLLILD